MSATEARPETRRTQSLPLGTIATILGAIALLLLNTALIAFYFFWNIADAATINGVESGAGYDPSSMLPNAHLMWIAANASLLFLIATDVCVTVWYFTNRRKPV
ncbi:hypothetical protein [Microbacterium stercoris]|uniref:Uncharacterized protein n=1 Tax=Microbacterium stercoris TaxID=2820289 RepID=A0A939TSJ3_9MICO|nr:hypothetical protein [Microbacterium stercoris]MBO3661964.1 hypothetical protein [Microbacterium stercoris]